MLNIHQPSIPEANHFFPSEKFKYSNLTCDRTSPTISKIAVKDFVTHLGNKSDNNFMYLRYAIADVENGKYRNLSIDSLPQGLMA